MHHVCHAVDRMGDTRVRFKCAKAVRLCAARWLHVRFGTKSIPSQRARVRRRLEKLRHSASLPCSHYRFFYVLTTSVSLLVFSHLCLPHLHLLLFLLSRSSQSSLFPSSMSTFSVSIDVYMTCDFLHRSARRLPAFTSTDND